VYLITISENYPERYWLDCDAKKFPDPLLLRTGQRVEEVQFSHLCFKVDPKVSIERILKYDYLFSGYGIDIISEKLAAILMASNKKAVQLIPTKIKQKETEYDGFYIINYLILRRAFDREKSTCKPLLEVMPNGPKKFTKIVLLPSEKGEAIFRAEEDFTKIVVTDSLAEKIHKAGIKGIELVKEEARF